MALVRDTSHKDQPGLRAASPIAIMNDSHELDDSDDDYPFLNYLKVVSISFGAAGTQFEDAKDAIMAGDPDFESSLNLCVQAMQKFFNNDFHGARADLEPLAETSMYHALGKGMLQFIPAILSFDGTQIRVASAALKHALALCRLRRRNSNLMDSILKRHNYADFTDIEAHAELIHGEANLLLALLAFIEYEDISGMVKGTIKIKKCYDSYKLSNNILHSNKEWSNERIKMHFESGVNVGMGTFSLFISLLPNKIILLLKFVGFKGNKMEGLKQLTEGSEGGGLRQELCQLVLLSYHLIICPHTGKVGDLQLSEGIINKQIDRYPKGVWFLLFRARLNFMSGQFEKAFTGYELAKTSQYEWLQIPHMCFWELMWLHSLKNNWREASAYADRLASESEWSRTIYLYQSAAMLLQANNQTSNEYYTCIARIQEAPNYMRRIAGKSLPMEKFVLNRCRRFTAQGNNLVLPALEMMCLWNVIETIEHNEDVALTLLELTQNTAALFGNEKMEWEGEYEKDNRALINYIYGCLLRHVGELGFAERALHRTLGLKNYIKEDHFLIPYAGVELAQCMLAMGELEKANFYLNEAKKKTHYALESRLHFRIHHLSQEICAKKAELEDKCN